MTEENDTELTEKPSSVVKIQAMKEGREARQKQLNYHRRYNAVHSESLLAKKAARYATDAAYREAIKARSRQTYLDKKAMKGEEKDLVCSCCGRPMPRLQKPILMSLQDGKRRYEVLFYTIGEVAKRLKRQQRTIKSWISEHIIPEAMYMNDAKRRIWTQDQVEMLERITKYYNLRPPADYKKLGFVDEVLHEWNKLQPLGIDPDMYEPDASGVYHRREQILSVAS